MKSLVFLAIFALGFVGALPTAEPAPAPAPVPEPVPIPEPIRGGRDSIDCNLKNGSKYHYEYDLTNTVLYNPCQPFTQGVFTRGIAKYDSTYNSYPTASGWVFCSKYSNRYYNARANINGTLYKVVNKSSGDSEGTWSDAGSQGEYESTNTFKLDGPGRLHDSVLIQKYKTKYQCVTGRDPICLFEYHNEEIRIQC